MSPWRRSVCGIYFPAHHSCVRFLTFATHFPKHQSLISMSENACECQLLIAFDQQRGPHAHSVECHPNTEFCLLPYGLSSQVLILFPGQGGDVGQPPGHRGGL